MTPVGPKKTLNFYPPVTVDDGQGGVSITPGTAIPIEGAFSVLSDRETLMYGKLGEHADYKFATDYERASTIELPYIVKLGSRSFKIQGIVNPLEQNRFLIFLLQERKLG